MENYIYTNRKIQSNEPKRPLYKSRIYSRIKHRFVDRHRALIFQDSVTFNEIVPVYDFDLYECFSKLTETESELNSITKSKVLTFIQEILRENGIHSFHEKINLENSLSDPTLKTFEFLEIPFIDDINNPVLFLSCNVSKQVRKNGYIDDYSSAAVLLLSISSLLKSLNEYLNVVILFIDTDYGFIKDQCLLDTIKPGFVNKYKIGGLVEIGDIYGTNFYTYSNFGDGQLFNFLINSSAEYGVSEHNTNPLTSHQYTYYSSSWLSATNYTDEDYNEDEKIEEIFNDVVLLNDYQKNSTIEFVKSSDFDVVYTYLVNLCILFSAAYK